MKRHYLAFDLGAESGRAVLGTLQAGRLSIEELHRFPNTPVRALSALYWDALRLFHEIKQGLGIAARKWHLDGLAVDAWGVDYAFLDDHGDLIENPRHYRDSRTQGVLKRAFEIVPREEIFAQTGIQFMAINTLYQLLAMKLAGSRVLDSGRTLLMMPDLFNYWLTGMARSELTIASTSQLFNPVAQGWAASLLERFGLSASVLPEIVQPGVKLGPALDAPTVPVYTTGCHDTASAVAAVPAEGSEWCYISSGTWSLMGVEIDAPVMDKRCLDLGFTNEMGFGKKIRLLKNIAGLWLLQECRRAWADEGRDYGYDELAQIAMQAEPFSALIDPDAFLEPGNMPVKIAQFCRDSGQRIPGTPAEFTRIILESLALRYRQVLENLESLLGRRLEVIHIVGGGSRNALLNQLVADATGRPVIAGPVEATAIGNLLIQAAGAGELEGPGEIRKVVRESFPLQLVTPHPEADWDRAHERMKGCTAAT